MRILVTGGAGFIGSHIVEYFHDKAEVRVLDNLRSGFIYNLAGFEHIFIHASILDRETIRRAMVGVDFVFHLAAMVSVQESKQKPIECNEINVAGTLVVLEEAARAKVKKVIFSSSAAIYGDDIIPKDETLLPEPKSPYAITKLDGEFYCKLFADERKVQTTCLRYFNVFGPRQDAQSQYAAAVSVFIDRAIRNETITIFGNGNQTRDFIFVQDIMAANVYFATQSNATGVFNVAYGRSTTINDLAKTICRLTASRSEIKHVAGRPDDLNHSLATIGKLLAVGFQPMSNFNDGLAATVDLYQKLVFKSSGKSSPIVAARRPVRSQSTLS